METFCCLFWSAASSLISKTEEEENEEQENEDSNFRTTFYSINPLFLFEIRAVYETDSKFVKIWKLKVNKTKDLTLIVSEE